MAKFDFENSTYNLLSDSIEGQNLLTYVLNDPDLLDVQIPYWPSAFSVSNSPIVTEGNGKASFTVQAKYPEHSFIADMRSPLGEGRTAEEGEAEEYSGSIADFIAPTWVEKATERMYKQKLFEKYGDDAALIKGYAQDVVKPRIESLNQAIDYMAVQAETTGMVRYDKGAGIKGRLYKADIPESNFLTSGGPKAWSDPDAPILDYMAKIEDSKVQEWGVDFSRQWKMDRDFFKNVVLQNKQVQNQIKIGWLAANGQLISQTDVVPNSLVTEENFNRFVIGSYPGLSPIKLVKARYRDRGKVYNPWPEGLVTLSPAGFAGELLRTDVLDEELYTNFGNNACSFTFARTENGLFTVMNSVLPNGNLKEWQTKVYMSAVPVITDFLYRVIVDTTKADE